jgi:hypothetical protein
VSFVSCSPRSSFRFTGDSARVGWLVIRVRASLRVTASSAGALDSRQHSWAISWVLFRCLPIAVDPLPSAFDLISSNAVAPSARRYQTFFRTRPSSEFLAFGAWPHAGPTRWVTANPQILDRNPRLRRQPLQNRYLVIGNVSARRAYGILRRHRDIGTAGLGLGRLRWRRPRRERISLQSASHQQSRR